jgi:hypothetical protein
MSLWPTRGNENQHRHPRESGGPLLVRNTMDSRGRGNEVFFRGNELNDLLQTNDLNDFKCAKRTGF